MSVPDPHNIERAAQLCTCQPDSFCDRACTVCHSPTWEGFGCVKRIHSTMIQAGNVPVSLPPNLDARTNPQLPPSPERIEEVIDFAEEILGPLEPWQANMLRAMANGDAKPKVLRGRTY